MQIRLLLPVLLLLAGPLRAQPSLLDKTGTLHLAETPLKEALRRVEAAYQVSFSYFDLPGEGTKVNVRVQGQPLREALAQVLSGTGLTYHVAGNQVILRAAAPPPAFLTLSGTVLDGESAAPLAYAAIGIKGRTLGTVSNVRGEFRFSIPAAYADDTLFVSYIGYKTHAAVVSTLDPANAHSIRLAVQPVALAEVVVTNQTLTPKEIVQTAVGRIPENYPAGPYLMDGFYREWSVRHPAGGAEPFPSLVEAAVGVLDPGYASAGKRHEKVFIKEIRRSANTEDTWNKLSRLLAQNFVRYNGARGNYDAFPPVLAFPNDLEYKMLETVVEDDEYFYVIGVAVPGSPAAYALYVGYDDYAIARIDLKGEGSAIQWLGPGERPGRGRLLRVDNTLRFRRIGDKMYPSYLRADWQTRLVDPASNEPVEENAFFSELLVSDVKTAGLEAETKALARTAMHPKVPMAEQARRPYNTDFWQHYNIIRENPLDEELTRLLERQKSLESQFRETGNPKAGGKSKRQ